MNVKSRAPKHPTVTFDPDADALYVCLVDGQVHETHPMGDLRLVDYAKDGTVLGIEFISASQGVDLADVPFAPTVAAAIGDSGYPIPIFA
jgi:uncharacterized protein YuzE